MIQSKSLADKKKWYSIHASKEFKELIIGESLVSDPNMLVGKKLEINLTFLINDPKKQNFKVKFRIMEIKDKDAYTDLIGYYLLPAYVRRAVRPSKSKVEDSFRSKTKDNLDVVAKPFLITKNLVSNSVKTSLRKKCREFLNNYFSDKIYGDIVNGLLTEQLQRELRDVLCKIYPLIICQIRVFERDSR